MAAMLVVKNNSLSLRWELHYIFMQILRKKMYCIDHKHGRQLTWLKTKNSWSYRLLCMMILFILQVIHLP